MRKKKILLIDDEEDFTMLLKLNIEMTTDCDVLVASNGEMGLDLVQRHKPDLVLLDFRMPGIDGLETLKRIKAIVPDLPVAMVTAGCGEEKTRQCFEAGAFEYITKPIDFKYLTTAVLAKLS